MGSVFKTTASLFIGCLLSLARVWAAEHCVILQYHHFSEQTPRVTSVTPAEFDAHLDYLRKGGFKVLPLQTVVDALRSGKPLPERCISLTVDDAYDSVYQVAFPRLRALGWPLTVFVNTGAVDQGLSAYMSWEQMREMAAAGVRFENHGDSHDHLIRRLDGESAVAWRERVRVDIQTAEQRISDELGRAPAYFAYPFGEYTPALQAVVNGLGLVGFGQQSGPAWSEGDFTALPRFPMAGAYAGMAGFRTKVTSLPMPLLESEPDDPLVPLEDWRPTLTLRLKPDAYRPDQLRCYINGSDDVELSWSEEQPDTLQVRPGQDLHPGRNRYNCTLPSATPGRYHWYSHNWIRRKADGGWYRE